MSSHEDGDRFWHVWRCAECRDAHRVDREIRRRLRATFGNAVPSPDLDERILAAMGFPPETEDEPRPPGREQPGRRFAPLSRRALLVAALTAAIAFLHLATERSSAQTLEQVLAAIGRVRSAHCSGWFVSYEDPSADAPSPPAARMRVDWWFQAPDRFRREMGPEVPEWKFPPGTLVVNGDQSVFHNTRTGGPPRRGRRQTRDLSPVDFFTPEGLLRRAARQKHARIREAISATGREARRVFTVEYRQPGRRVPMRFRWVLTVDPATDRIVQADWRLQWQDGWRWRTGATETLDRFEYNIPLADKLFRFDTVERVAPQGLTR